MKRRLLFILSLLLPTLLMANPVGKEQAQEKALSFLNGRSAAKARGPKAASNLRLVMSQDCYHVFNIGTGDGFVIVSGDDCAPDILGYADSGTIDPQSMPDNMKAWLQGYADQIEWMKAHGVKAEKNFTTRAPKSFISPLITTNWNQNDPYNQECPDFFTYGKSVTGCVATALAQVLYNSYQRTGKPNQSAEIPSYTCGRNWTGLGQINVSTVPATEFDWNNMQLSYSGSESAIQKQAIARLMLCCGASVNMDYANSSNGGSSASLSKIPSALTTYFGFDPCIRYYNRNIYSTEDWENMVYNELANNRPVLYGGQSSGGGHAFVCDGYDSDGYYHINWGWGGNHDGNFLLSALNPYGTGTGGSSSADGYSMDQDIVIGISAPSGEIAPEEGRLTVLSFGLTNSDDITRGSGIPISYSYNYRNDLTYSYDLEYGLGVFDESDNLVSSNGFIQIENWAHGVYYYGSTTTTLSDGLTAGKIYKIKPVSRFAGSSEVLKCIKADDYYIKATVTDTKIALELVNPVVNLAASNINLTTDGTVNTVQTVTATISNNSTSDFNGNIYLIVDGTKESGNGISVSAGGTTTAYFSFKPTSVGAKTINITTDEAGTEIIGNSSLDIIAASSATLQLSNFEVANSDYPKVYGNSFIVSFSAKNNGSEEYNNGFKGTLYKKKAGESSGSPVKEATSSETIAVGETKTITLEFNNLEYGQTYFCWASYYSESTYQESEAVGGYAYEICRGFITIDSNGKVSGSAPTANVTIPASAAVVDLRGQSTITNVDATAANPNCIFLLDGDATTPSGITKNIVKGTNAESISLTDGYNFYSPIDFTANNIEFNYTFTVGADGSKGWNTLVLPFNVTKVTANGTEIDWFKSGSDSGKNFWVKEFVSDGASTVNFGYASAIEANKPYIVAFPGNHWGTNWDLSSKAIKFIGQNVNVVNSIAIASVSGDNYRFVGSTHDVSKENLYILNTESNKFIKYASGNSPAFRAYFLSSTHGSSAASLAIGGDMDLTGIDSIINSEAQEDGIYYNLKGQRVANPTKGLYILNGKKVVIK